MKKISGARIVIETLIQENVKVIFGYLAVQYCQFMMSYSNKTKLDIS